MYFRRVAQGPITRSHSDSQIHVRGVSGEVDEVYTADEATLTFAHLRQPTEDVLVLDLKHLRDDVGTEVSGIVGFTTLRFLNIDIDYRDGPVFIQYQGPPVRCLGKRGCLNLVRVSLLHH